MTDSDIRPLLLSTRINRLFDTFHLRDSEPQSNDEVANAVTITLGRTVSAHAVEQLRVGTFDEAIPQDPGLLDAIAQHFAIPEAYLGTADDDVAQIHRNLQTVAEARDAGVSLALRGDGTDLGELASIMAKVVQRQHALTPDETTST